MTRLHVEGISKRYRDVVALDAVSFTLTERSRMVVIGRSGSGKSTLLRILAGFEAPDSGRIAFDDQTMAEGARSVPAHRRGIGIVAQDGALFPHLSVTDNIGFGLPRGRPGRAALIRDLAAMVELPSDALARAPHELSGGQQQRVALARALAREPRLILLDEPFSALDAGLREATRAAVVRILDRAGTGCILVTHDQAEALSFGDGIGVLRAGRLTQAGTPEEVYRRPVDAGVARLLGEAVILRATVREGWASCRLGRIPVGPGAPEGPAEIMLRADQIRPVEAGPAEGCAGRVVSILFGGALSTVGVALEDDPDRSVETLALTVFSLDLPRIGERVGLRLRGTAHVLGLSPAKIDP